MKLGPCHDETPLPPRQRPGDQIDRIESEHRDLILIISMEIWLVMRRPDLHVHPNDDPMKAAELGGITAFYAGRQCGQDHFVGNGGSGMRTAMSSPRGSPSSS